MKSDANKLLVLVIAAAIGFAVGYAVLDDYKDHFEVTVDETDPLTVSVKITDEAEYSHYLVDWGDKSTDETLYTADGAKHTYAEAGEYTVTITAYTVPETSEGAETPAEPAELWKDSVKVTVKVAESDAPSKPDEGYGSEATTFVEGTLSTDIQQIDGDVVQTVYLSGFKGVDFYRVEQAGNVTTYAGDVVSFPATMSSSSTTAIFVEAYSGEKRVGNYILDSPQLQFGGLIVGTYTYDADEGLHFVAQKTSASSHQQVQVTLFDPVPEGDESAWNWAYVVEFTDGNTDTATLNSWETSNYSHLFTADLDGPYTVTVTKYTQPPVDGGEVIWTQSVVIQP